MRLLVTLFLVLALALSAVVLVAEAHHLYGDERFGIASWKPYEAVDASVQARELGPGINVIIGHEGFEARYFVNIREIGYRSVRLPLFAFDKMDATGRLDLGWLKSLDRAILAALDAGLLVVLEVHDSDACANDKDMCERRLPELWRSLSSHFHYASNNIIFEILNEPHGALDAESWNQLLSKVLKIIRLQNPDRNVVIGTSGWSAIETLDSLALPADDHLIVAVHYYSPFRFTHARGGGGGVGSLPPVRFAGTEEEVKSIQADFDKILRWRAKVRRPVILGEFGVCIRCGSLEDRSRWVSMVSHVARQKNIPHIYWSFDGPFGVFEFSTGKWDKVTVAAQMGRSAKSARQ